jgi:hypothetical protein
MYGIKFIIWIFVILLFLYIIPKIIFLGSFNFSETFSTRYSFHDSTTTIETSYFQIETPKGWIHIFNGYGDEGDAVGSFYTKDGLLKYEYGIFSNSFLVDSIFVFSRDSLIVNRFKVYVAKNDKNETGIYIPQQHEMDVSFSFFMSDACTKNYEAIIKCIESIEFKKLYHQQAK